MDASGLPVAMLSDVNSLKRKRRVALVHDSYDKSTAPTPAATASQPSPKAVTTDPSQPAPAADATATTAAPNSPPPAAGATNTADSEASPSASPPSRPRKKAAGRRLMKGFKVSNV